MKFLLAIFITIVCAMYDDANGARILMMTPHQAKSHYIVYEALLKRLAERGHQVVSFNHFPQKTVLPNFTDVDISSSMPYVVGTRSIELAYKRTMWQKLKSISHLSLPTCESVLEHPELKKLLHSKEKFDMYIMEIFLSDCFIGIGHALKIPIVVGVSSTVSYPWTNDIFRNPDIPSYIPNSVLSNFSDEMNFFERATNLMYLFISKLAYRYLADRPGYEIAKKHFGDDLPDLDTLRSKMSLILTNGHRAVNTPRALAPEYKELGGMHIPASGPPPLPKDLKDFLDSSENGVIYFSLGSQINMSTLPNEVLMSFYEAFERVPQRILWKCIESNMPRLPKKVKCIEWAPQLSILCDPNVRLFISHGGMLGSQEAVYCGVPILGIPLYGDQHLNLAYFVKRGFALKLDYYQLSYVQEISNALNELLLNKSYRDMARKASFEFRDRLIPPLDEGVYWIEYLLRHGPDSLRTTAISLTWYQYLLLDVILAIIISIVLTIFIVYKLFKLLIWKRSMSIDVNKKRS